MNRLNLLLIILILSSCKDKNRIKDASTNDLNTLQKVRNECVVATISFYKNLASTPLVLKPIKDKESIDTVFSFIGQKVIDTGCHLCSMNSPIGLIDFYKDTLMSEHILSLWFTLDGSCTYFYESITKPTTSFEITSYGKSYLSNQQKRIEANWK